MVVITVSPHPRPAGTTGPTRTSGVEKVLLLVDAVPPEPADAVRALEDGALPAAPGHQVPAELQQEQIEVAGPSPTGSADQLAAIRRARHLAESAARAAFALRQDPRDVVGPVLEATHR